MFEITPQGWLVLAGLFCLGVAGMAWCLCRVSRDPIYEREDYENWDIDSTRG